MDREEAGDAAADVALERGLHRIAPDELEKLKEQPPLPKGFRRSPPQPLSHPLPPGLPATMSGASSGSDLDWEQDMAERGLAGAEPLVSDTSASVLASSLLTLLVGGRIPSPTPRPMRRRRPLPVGGRRTLPEEPAR